MDETDPTDFEDEIDPEERDEEDVYQGDMEPEERDEEDVYPDEVEVDRAI